MKEDNVITNTEQQLRALQAELESQTGLVSQLIVGIEHGITEAELTGPLKELEDAETKNLKAVQALINLLDA